MTDDNTIVPIEYVNDKWVCNDDVTIWFNDSIVTNVRWHDEGTYTRKGYNVYLRGEERGIKVDAYSHCLRVEPNNNEYLREQICNLVGAADNDVLLETLQELRQCIDWKKADREAANEQTT